MRKAMTWLIATIVTVGATSAFAADRAVVGLEWGYGPTIRNLNKAKFEQNANLYWKVSDDFTIGVIGGSGMWGMTKKQKDENGTTHTLVKEGTTQVSGIRFLKAMPMMNMVTGGIDLGVVSFNQTYAAITRDTNKLSDGSPAMYAGYGLSADTGPVNGVIDAGEQLNADIPLNTTAGLLGLTGRMSLFRAESKTITSEFVITASLRYVALNPINAMGTVMDVQHGAGGAGSNNIGPVRNYHNLGLTLGANLWF